MASSVPGRTVAPGLRLATPRAMVRGGGASDAANHRPRLSLPELGLPGRGPAAAAAAAALPATRLAGEGARLRVGAPLPSGLPPLHRSAVAQVQLSAAQ